MSSDRPPHPERKRQFNMRLSDEEARRLDTLADHYGINAAALVRMLLKEKEGELRKREVAA